MHDDNSSPSPVPLVVAEDRRFRALRQFNSDDGRRLAGRRDRMAPIWMNWFNGPGLPDRLARALSARYAIDMKEFCESFEFFERIRKDVRRPTVVDLCCGHGLTGILFAIFERVVEEVVLVDTRRPKSHDKIILAVEEVAPWALPKLRYVERSIRGFEPSKSSGLVGIHACGGRTDSCLNMAIEHRLPIAVMPCCHAFVKYGGRALPFHQCVTPDLAVDIDRTYRMQRAGFDVKWNAVPRAVTAKNRIIVAVPSM